MPNTGILEDSTVPLPTRPPQTLRPVLSLATVGPEVPRSLQRLEATAPAKIRASTEEYLFTGTGANAVQMDPSSSLITETPWPLTSALVH